MLSFILQLPFPQEKMEHAWESGRCQTLIQESALWRPQVPSQHTLLHGSCSSPALTYCSFSVSMPDLSCPLPFDYEELPIRYSLGSPGFFKLLAVSGFLYFLTFSFFLFSFLKELPR